ncbi:flagellar hook-associated protein 3 FlgL [Paenibacillus sp. V4I9]|uniref:flagellar hook-associated protein FlgL n=1 Tax=Paenibacillus sp. V4I9 TaxID=3042308 RepID=UPI00278686C2|nr:flagellar hook-associated protein FlgL [Paenibacillus sp. V4I9]MDQ0891967.1 flagellar hook-associated protein 3 FlgL [Paenibacillus sp. V4I9]
MVLRVTQGMIQSQLLSNISNNVKRMSVSQNQLATGRKINKPSDDPVGITYALRYRSEISINDQYQRNIDAAKSAVDHTDTVLSQINDVMQKAKELTVQGLNGTNPQSALDAIGIEMGQLYETAVGLGNDQLNGKYTFNGQFTDKQPYNVATASSDQTDDQKINFQVSAGISIPINQTGNEVFGAPDTVANPNNDNLFKILKGLQNAFSPTPPATANLAVAKNLLSDLTNRFDKFLTVRSEVGARANRIDLMDNRIKDLDVNLTELSSKTEDADMAETITKLKTDENVYQASLSTGAKIIQPSLIDFLR